MRWISRSRPVPCQTLAIKPCFSFKYHQPLKYLQNRKRRERWFRSGNCGDLFNFSVAEILKTDMGEIHSVILDKYMRPIVRNTKFGERGGFPRRNRGDLHNSSVAVAAAAAGPDKPFQRSPDTNWFWQRRYHHPRMRLYGMRNSANCALVNMYL